MAFEAFLEKRPPDGGRRHRPLVYTLSLGLHVAVLLVFVARSFWQVDELSPRSTPVHLIAGLTPPPPPPPPPPAQHETVAHARPRPTPRKPDEVVQPREAPAEEAPAAEPDDGVAGGVEGGVAGGVVGSVAPVAATPPPPPPVVERAPTLVSPTVAAAQRLTDINDPRFRPSLPPHLNHPGTIVRGLFKICVSAEGKVSDVKVLRSADPTVDDDWAKVMRSWQYRPLALNGRPSPFCHPLMMEVRSVL
jgi:protein TonB